MADQPSDPPSKAGRALMTQRERQVLRGAIDADANYRNKVRSMVRRRISQALAEDVEILSTHFEEGHQLTVDIVCNDA